MVVPGGGVDCAETLRAMPAQKVTLELAMADHLSMKDNAEEAPIVHDFAYAVAGTIILSTD